MVGVPRERAKKALQPDRGAAHNCPCGGSGVGFVSRAFKGRPRDQSRDARLPPGQYLVRDFPVLSAGPTPHTALTQLSFSIEGEVDDRDTQR